jgi:fumarylacetoacetase
MNANKSSKMKSFIQVSTEHPFPIQNLPYGIFSHAAQSEKHIGVAIGDFVLDLTVLENQGWFNEIHQEPLFQYEVLNPFMAAGFEVWHRIRQRIQYLLQADVPDLQAQSEILEQVLKPQKGCTMYLPIHIGGYTDFYASRFHAENVGTMFRGKDKALMPNWLHLPVGYHGRASSIVVSGTPIVKPKGQILNKETTSPEFGHTRKLDFEIELGFVMGTGNELGKPISVQDAEKHIFGAVLVNDWSARDIQQWEYAPLGPFLGKNFATSISPWIVPMEALKPFESVPLHFENNLLPYLQEKTSLQYDIELELYLKPTDATFPQKIASTNTKHLYWTYRQMIAHHTVNGCNLQTGDLLATGTISGPEQHAWGSLLEQTWDGQKPLQIDENSMQTYLEIGDFVQISGFAQASTYRIGFGDVHGIIIE